MLGTSKPYFPGWRPEWSGRSPVIAEEGMVATSQPLATEAAIHCLREGGNAVDAALTAAAVLTVVEPMSTSFGGDLFAQVYWARTDELKGFNASGCAPEAATLEDFHDRGYTELMPERGILSATVPGAFAGFCLLQETYGSFSLSDILEPACRLARHGFPVSPIIAREWVEKEELLQAQTAAATHYLRGGKAPRAGEKFTIPAIAETLGYLARSGRDGFYRGSVAEAFVKLSDEQEGLFQLRDFSSFQPEEVSPLSAEYRGAEVFELPPNGQGLTVLLMLRLLEPIALESMGFQDELTLHYLIESTKLAYQVRNRFIADPAFAEVPINTLLGDENIEELRGRLDPERCFAPVAAADTPSGQDTVYLSVVDRDRNCVSLIQSLFHSFGSGLVAGNTGILLHNRAHGFSLVPDHPNALAPGKRPFHTLIPGMAFSDGEPLLSFGVMGGHHQPQGHLQFLTNILCFAQDVQSALDAPRFHYEDPHVYLEPGLPQRTAEGLRRRGHHIEAPERNRCGGGQAIREILIRIQFG
ncbi:MAG: gamma-glutamyltransferase family protein [bacterium]